MSVEIERRFEVPSLDELPLGKMPSTLIVQSYVTPGGPCKRVSVTLALSGSKKLLTVKTEGRDNFELELPVDFGKGLPEDITNLTTRIRISNHAKATLTVKGPKDGATAPEFETDIPLMDGFRLMGLSTYGCIAKNRYRIPVESGHVWELDVFRAENMGLVLAEIELKSEDEEFTKPAWVGKEVTHDHSLSNSALARKSIKNY